MSLKSVGDATDKLRLFNHTTAPPPPPPGAAVMDPTLAGRARNDCNLFAAGNYLFPVRRRELSIWSWQLARLIVARTASDERARTAICPNGCFTTAT